MQPGIIPSLFSFASIFLESVNFGKQILISESIFNDMCDGDGGVVKRQGDVKFEQITLTLT